MKCKRCGREEDPETLNDWGHCAACEKIDGETESDQTTEEKMLFALEYED